MPAHPLIRYLSVDAFPRSNTPVAASSERKSEFELLLPIITLRCSVRQLWQRAKCGFKKAYGPTMGIHLHAAF